MSSACKSVLRRLLLFVGLSAACLAGLTAAEIHQHVWTDLPPVKALSGVRLPAVTQIFASDGSLLTELYWDRRYILAPDEIPPLVRDAFVAAEDDGFYRHRGADFAGVVRAFLRNLKAGRTVEGGSTITQQVVKAMLLTSDRSYLRKLRELVLARRLEDELSKDEILALYLNDIYLGNGAYGVAAAARHYFGKDPARLALHEAALLAGIPKAPSRYNPIANWPAARRRQRYVLGRMWAEGFITRAERDRALREPLDLAPTSARPVTAPYFLERVRVFLEARYGQPALYGLGLRVYTTLDRDMQRAAEEAVGDGLNEVARRHGGYRGLLRDMEPAERDSFLLAQRRSVRRFGLRRGELQPAVVTFVRPRGASVQIGGRTGKLALADGEATHLRLNDLVQVRVIDPEAEPPLCELAERPLLQGALVALEPETGYVRALVGGADFERSRFDRATQARRQLGSAAKPFVYAAAFERRFTPASVVFDGPISFWDHGRVWRPRNYEKRFYGNTTLATALVFSRNVVTVKLARQVGIRNVVDAMRSFGLGDRLQPDLSIALGSIGTSPLLAAAAYASFANGGRRPEPLFVTRVTDANGQTLEEIEPRSSEVVSPATAYQITRVLQDAIRFGSGRRAAGLTQPSAGKTGTTSDFRDAWFVGFTPRLVASVWVGFDRQQTLGKDESGGRVAAPIWKEFMRSATRSTPVETFTRPDGVRCDYINPRTGRRAVQGAPSQFLCFKDGQGPRPALPVQAIARPARPAVPPEALPSSSPANAPHPPAPEATREERYGQKSGAPAPSGL